jgi:hypothetical protein
MAAAMLDLPERGAPLRMMIWPGSGGGSMWVPPVTVEIPPTTAIDARLRQQAALTADS